MSRNNGLKKIRKAKRKEEGKKATHINSEQEPEQSTFLENIKVDVPNDVQIPKESEFVRKVKELTKGYSKEPLDIMLMYSNAKGTDKMSFDEFSKYESLQSKLARTLQENKNNHLNAYNKVLESYPEDSDEAIILQGLIDNLPKEPER